MLRNCFFILILIAFDVSCCLANESQLIVEQFKSYFKTINSVSMEFTQSDLNGSSATGALLVSKPFKFRCNYYLPFPILVIGNKNYVSIYDYDMETTSYIKKEDNIFNFLTNNDIDFEKHFIVQSATDENGLLSLVLYHEKSERLSEISFDKNKNKLDQIKIFEDDNIITLTFTNILQVTKFDSSLFEFKDPELFGSPIRYTKNELESMLTYDKR